MNTEMCIIMPDADEVNIIQQAVDLVNHFNQEGLMLPADLEKYQQLAAAAKLAVLITDEFEVIGSVAYTQEYSNGMWEVGGLAVKEAWQGKGHASDLVKHLLENKKHVKTLAVANSNSLPLFQKLGGQKINFPNKLPQEIYEPCAQCPVKPETGCCDTFVSLANIVIDMAIKGMTPRQSDRLIYGVGEPQMPEYYGAEVPPEEW
jgi:N-acetylglutamate synthase-like GNAT family acetyltransferase